MDHWDKESKNQSKLECYRALNRKYSLSEYLSTVRDVKQRRILTKYRLSDHSLAIEKGRHRQTWLPKEERICVHCDSGEIETETHFLLYCGKYKELREKHFDKISKLIAEFHSSSDSDQMKMLLGEDRHPSAAAKFIYQLHTIRNNLQPWSCTVFLFYLSCASINVHLYTSYVYISKSTLYCKYTLILFYFILQ